MNTFQDKVVLITGAASGIGRQLALALAAEGARVAALDLQTAALEALAQELKGKPVATAYADVTNLVLLRAAVASLEQALGGPTDLLIASAGIGRETSALSFSAADVNAQIAVNLVGVVNSIDAVLPAMRARKSGHLAVLSSLASYRGVPRMAGYCASKAGVNALLDALRVELRPLGIAVTTICPGWIRTPLTAQARIDPSIPMMEVGEAARRILGALRRRRAFFAFPWGSVWQMRVLGCLPRRLSDWMTARYMRRYPGPSS